MSLVVSLAGELVEAGDRVRGLTLGDQLQPTSRSDRLLRHRPPVPLFLDSSPVLRPGEDRLVVLQNLNIEL